MIYEQTMEHVHRPVVAFLNHGFGAIIPVPNVEPSERFELIGSRSEDYIEMSMISFYNLHKAANIRIQWVDSLRLHLEFDSQLKTLKIFRFPSFCLIMGKTQGSGPLFQ